MTKGQRVLIHHAQTGSAAYYGVIASERTHVKTWVEKKSDGIKRNPEFRYTKKSALCREVHIEEDGHNAIVPIDLIEVVDYDDHGRGIERPEWRP